MLKRLSLIALLLGIAASLTGCVVAPAAPAQWVPAHYDSWGYWHHGYWR
ncbi:MULTISPECIES: hypothetical protein [Pandoraea]|nr:MULTISPECIES: hypothetical protein [Pandoraea]